MATPFFGLILVFIVIALVAGFIANLVVGKGKGFQNWELFVAGIIGSFVGGTLLNLIFEQVLDISISGIVGSTIGVIDGSAWPVPWPGRDPPRWRPWPPSGIDKQFMDLRRSRGEPRGPGPSKD